MRTLIIEDDDCCRLLLEKYICNYGDYTSTCDGESGIEAFKLAHKQKKPYDLVCLDIMMPKKDGQQVLKEIRNIENDKKIVKSDAVKVIITTVLDYKKNIIDAYKLHCDEYIIKPFDKKKFISKLVKLKLIEQ